LGDPLSFYQRTFQVPLVKPPPLAVVVDGSLVPDVESDRLIGKVEGVKGNIIYEGRALKECEQEFREAVLKYKKGETI